MFLVLAGNGGVATRAGPPTTLLLGFAATTQTSRLSGR